MSSAKVAAMCESARDSVESLVHSAQQSLQHTIDLVESIKGAHNAMSVTKNKSSAVMQMLGAYAAAVTDASAAFNDNILGVVALLDEAAQTDVDAKAPAGQEAVTVTSAFQMVLAQCAAFHENMRSATHQAKRDYATATASVLFAQLQQPSPTRHSPQAAVDTPKAAPTKSPSSPDVNVGNNERPTTLRQRVATAATTTAVTTTTAATTTAVEEQPQQRKAVGTTARKRRPIGGSNRKHHDASAETGTAAANEKDAERKEEMEVTSQQQRGASDEAIDQLEHEQGRTSRETKRKKAAHSKERSKAAEDGNSAGTRSKTPEPPSPQARNSSPQRLPLSLPELRRADSLLHGALVAWLRAEEERLIASRHGTTSSSSSSSHHKPVRYFLSTESLAVLLSSSLGYDPNAPVFGAYVESIVGTDTVLEIPRFSATHAGMIAPDDAFPAAAMSSTPYEDDKNSDNEYRRQNRELQHQREEEDAAPISMESELKIKFPVAGLRQFPVAAVGSPPLIWTTRYAFVAAASVSSSMQGTAGGSTMAQPVLVLLDELCSGHNSGTGDGCLQVLHVFRRDVSANDRGISVSACLISSVSSDGSGASLTVSPMTTVGHGMVRNWCSVLRARYNNSTASAGPGDAMAGGSPYARTDSFVLTESFADPDLARRSRDVSGQGSGGGDDTQDDKQRQQRRGGLLSTTLGITKTVAASPFVATKMVFNGASSAVRGQQHALFRRNFPHLAEESILDIINCALREGALFRQGFMFITPSKLCFQSTVLSGRVELDIDDIHSFEKQRTALIFDNAILVTTKSEETFLFSSFLQRNETLKTLLRWWSVPAD